MGHRAYILKNWHNLQRPKLGKLGSCAGADALGKFPAENAAAPFSKYSFKWLYSNPYHIEQYVTNGPTYVIGRLLRYQLPNPNQYDLKDHFLLACDWSFRISCIGSVGHGDKKLPKSYSVGYELKYTCSNPTLFLECKGTHVVRENWLTSQQDVHAQLTR